MCLKSPGIPLFSFLISIFLANTNLERLIWCHLETALPSSPAFHLGDVFKRSPRQEARQHSFRGTYGGGKPPTGSSRESERGLPFSSDLLVNKRLKNNSCGAFGKTSVGSSPHHETQTVGTGQLKLPIPAAGSHLPSSTQSAFISPLPPAPCKAITLLDCVEQALTQQAATSSNDLKYEKQNKTGFISHTRYSQPRQN